MNINDLTTLSRSTENNAAFSALQGAIAYLEAKQNTRRAYRLTITVDVCATDAERDMLHAFMPYSFDAPRVNKDGDTTYTPTHATAPHATAYSTCNAGKSVFEFARRTSTKKNDVPYNAASTEQVRNCSAAMLARIAKMPCVVESADMTTTKHHGSEHSPLWSTISRNTGSYSAYEAQNKAKRRYNELLEAIKLNSEVLAAAAVKQDFEQVAKLAAAAAPMHEAANAIAKALGF